MTSNSKPTWLLEAAWEVCNKVGGIHTVLATKLAHAKQAFDNHYLSVGPWVGPNNLAFHQEEWPKEWAKLPAELADRGVTAYYGRWLIDGSPMTVLLDWNGLVPQLNQIKAKFWELYQWESMGSDFYDVDTPLLWSYSVGILAEALAKIEGKVLLQAHEWMAGGAVLYLNQTKHPDIKTVFTTHATVLGRALSSRGVKIYAELPETDPDQKARECNIVPKHQLEALSAQQANIFTTVSRLTGREAAVYLKRNPDYITENGLDMSLFPDVEAALALKKESRQQLVEFLTAYFYPSYRFPVQNAFLTFTMGRYETHNKGYDLYLSALKLLNEKYKAEIKEGKRDPESKALVALFLVPGDQIGVRPEVLRQLAVFAHAKDQLLNCYHNQEQILLESILDRDRQVPTSELIPAQIQEEIRRLVLPLAHPDEVPISPMQLRNPGQDSISQIAKSLGLDNAEDDPVKVVFIPAYVDGFDGLFNKPLYNMVAGCDLGVFPSYYEPWGYTPMESLALLNPAITSDLAGFGIAVEQRGIDHGVWMLDRETVDDNTAAIKLAELIEAAYQTSDRDFLDLRLMAYQAAEKFDWNILFANYQEAYKAAWNK